MHQHLTDVSDDTPQKGHCGLCAADKDEAGSEAGGGLAGRSLAVWAVGVFLLPLALAIGGASMLRAHPGLQALGAVTGLGVGALSAWIVTRYVRFKK